MTSSGIDDVYVVKLDPSGNFLWAKIVGGAGSDYSWALKTDPAGNAFISGNFLGTVDFDPGAGIYNLTTPYAGLQEAFILKLDPNGNFVWVKTVGGTSEVRPYGLCLDAAQNIYTTGYFAGTIDFDPGVGSHELTKSTYYGYVLKLDSGGNFVWVKSFGGVNGTISRKITVSNSGDLYATGEIDSAADFSDGAGTTVVPSAGGHDIFIAKWNSLGDIGWAKSIGGTSDDFGKAITTDLAGNVITAANFKNTVDLDPDAGVQNATTAGLDDFFLIKLGLPSMGIYDLVQEKKITIYPNPVNKILNIENLIGDYIYAVYDLLGKQIRIGAVSTTNSTVNLEELKSGIYLMKLIDAKGETAVIKIIKE